MSMKKKQPKQKMRKVMSLTVILVILSALMIIGGSALERKWNAVHMDYEIQPMWEDNGLQVSLVIGSKVPIDFTIPGQSGLKNLLCVGGSGQVLDFDETEEGFRLREKPEGPIKISFEVPLGRVGKHGKNGGVASNYIVFEGGQFLILPQDIANATAHNVYDLNICYNKIPSNWKGLIPYPKNKEQRQTQVKDIQWSQLYNIARSSYAFGAFKEVSTKEKRLNVYCLDQSSFEEKSLIGDNINRLYEFYIEKFGFSAKVNLLLLEEEMKLIGGSGYPTISASFNPKHRRDWELLSHRLFHSFFESKEATGSMHMPPQLWFFEGLATYYENRSMEALSNELKEKLGYADGQGLMELYERYTYGYYKDTETCRIVPMQEEAIIRPEQVEFLHYTLAPLIIENMVEWQKALGKKEDLALDYVLRNRQKAVTVKDILTKTLADQSVDFAKAYLFNNEYMTLNFAGLASRDQEEIVKSLQVYEDTMSSWAGSRFPLDRLSTEYSENVNNFALKNQLVNSEYYQQGIDQSMPVVFGLLNYEDIRKQVLGLKGEELWRQKALVDEEKIVTWKTFIENNCTSAH